LNQTEKTIKEFKNVSFYRVIEPGAFIPDRLSNLENLKHIHYRDLGEKIPVTIYSDQNHQKTII
jgi:hypothetical protein